MSEILVAKEAGFCFGVRRATDLLEERIANRRDGERILTLGHIIHNETYLESLSARGVETIGDGDLEAAAASAGPDSPVTVFLRAHGVQKGTADRLETLSTGNPWFSYVDCTCPFVEKIRRIARETDPEKEVLIVFGREDHPEVQGILSCFSGEKRTFGSLESFKKDLESGFLSGSGSKTPVIAVQTTFSLSEWTEIQNFCKKVFTDLKLFDTICNVTENRQREAEALARSCDRMIVIGGQESSNTEKLYRLCLRYCGNTIRIGSAADLPAGFGSSQQRIGIVAGASTPRSSIEEVYQRMSEISTENFGELLDSESSCKTVKQGEIVKGTVTFVSDKELQVDLGTSVTGIIKAENVVDDPSAKLTEMFNIGDEVEAKVMRVSDIEGIAELSKKAAEVGLNWKVLVDACESKATLTGKVVDVVNSGVIVLVASNRVFVPASLSGVPRNGDLNELKDQTVELKIIEIKEGRPRKAVGSVREVIREKAKAERKAREAEFWDKIEVGQEYQGKVRNMTDYGAFVDIGGGHDGMVHVTELSWRRVGKPSDVCNVGDTLTVYVREVDKQKKRISLTCKNANNKPWDQFCAQYQVGSVASVKIVSLTAFGAFAEILPGVDGLIHISQIADHKIGKAEDVLEVGQTVDAKILDIDYEKKKISLSIRALIEEAAAYAAEAGEEETAEAAEETEEAQPAEAVEETPADGTAAE
ncbi:MAG: 4-hydroxy-3-methylbut-2-enyl diphosphate reductase [Clostridia bacterium]|nr:4-hydroxy-3-methylbut-2-enyl diphosphate reductase [Clostridia bacterium]